MGQNRRKHRINSHPIIHCPEQTSVPSEQVSGASERANERASGLVLHSVFFIVLAHSAVVDAPIHRWYKYFFRWYKYFFTRWDGERATSSMDESQSTVYLPFIVLHIWRSRPGSAPGTILSVKELINDPDLTMGQNRKKHRRNSHPIIHFPTSSRVTEMSGRMSAAEHAKRVVQSE